MIMNVYPEPNPHKITQLCKSKSFIYLFFFFKLQTPSFQAQQFIIFCVTLHTTSLYIKVDLT